MKSWESSDPYYDLFEDFNLIVSSFLSQYGVRIYSNDFKTMKWDEFCALLSGLGPDTALGRIVQIRAEDDPERIKLFTPDQLKIHADWKKKVAADVTEEQMEEFLEQMKNVFIELSGGVKN